MTKKEREIFVEGMNYYHKQALNCYLFETLSGREDYAQTHRYMIARDTLILMFCNLTDEGIYKCAAGVWPESEAPEDVKERFKDKKENPYSFEEEFSFILNGITPVKGDDE